MLQRGEELGIKGTQGSQQSFVGYRIMSGEFDGLQ